MSYKSHPAVIGSATHFVASEHTQALEELIYEVSQAALADAGLAIDDIDGIVVAANDQYDGRAISVMAASGSVGGVDRDILSTPSSGEHAFVVGALRVASGQFRTQLVVSWSPTEVSSFSEAQRLAADPYFHRRLPLDEMSSHALQASSLGARVDNLEDMALSIVVKNRRNGAKAWPDLASGSVDAAEIKSSPTLRWPVRQGMVAAPVTGLVAMVLASPEWVADKRRSDAAWIKGMGWATEPSFLGDRDLATLPSLAAATKQAYDMAGVQAPLQEFQVAEVADATPYQELLAYEGLGLCGREDWERQVSADAFGPSGKLPVNLSGGALTLNPVFCTGLMRINELANQLRGRAGANQLADVEAGVAHAASGVAMQYNTVVVMTSRNAGTAQ